MDVQLLPLISYLVAAAYLIGWLFQQVWKLLLILRDWKFQRQAAGKVKSLKLLSRSNNRVEIFPILAGAILGMLFAYWIVSWISREWLLLVLVALAILSEELQSSHREMQLLAVIVLIDRVHFHAESGVDFFEALSKSTHDLPEGEVRNALWKVIHRCRSGAALDECVSRINGINPYLNELILTMKHLNWQTGPALALVLDRLLQRAGRKWDLASRFMLIKEQFRVYVRFGRAATITALFILSVRGFLGQATVWPSHSMVLLFGLVIIASGLLLSLALTSSWPRRVMAALLILAAMVPITSRISLQIPPWIQVRTTTHLPTHAPVSIPGHEPTEFYGRTKTMFVEQNAPGDGIQTTLTPELPATRLIPAPTHTMPTLSTLEFEDSCCHRMYQPR